MERNDFEFLILLSASWRTFAKCANTKLLELRSGFAYKIITGSSTGQSPVAKNPRPSFLWACMVFLSTSAQSTLLLFFSVTLFAKRQKRRLHSNRHHRVALAPEKKQLKAIIHNMKLWSFPCRIGKAIGKPIT